MPYSAAFTTGQPNPDQSAKSRSPEIGCVTTACNTANGSFGNPSPSTSSSLSVLSPACLQHSSSDVLKGISALTLKDQPLEEKKRSSGLVPSLKQAGRSCFYANSKEDDPSSASSVLVDSALLPSLGNHKKQQPSSASLPSSLSPSSHQLAPLRFDGESDLSLSYEFSSFLSESASDSRGSAVASSPLNSSLVSRVPQELPTKSEPCLVDGDVNTTDETAHPPVVVSTPPSGHISVQAQGHTSTTSAADVLPSPPALNSAATASHTTTISDEEHLDTNAQQYHQLMTSTNLPTPNTVSGETTPQSKASLSDGAFSPSRMSTSSQSSYSSNDGQQQQQSHPGYSQRPLSGTPLTLENLKPVPQKSEDWAALVDTPASPIERFHPSMMMMPPLPPPVIGGPRPLSPSSPLQFQAGSQARGMVMTTPSGAAYTDSPGPDTSADYMQHVSQHQQYHNQQQHYYHMQHTQTDPGQRQQQYPYPQQQQQQGHFPYQHHQHRNSTPSFQVGAFEMTDASLPDGSTAAANGANAHAANRKSYRKSWSASETLDAYGTLTPPRMNLDHYRGSAASSSRGSLNSKPSSPAMSVSLLTDAAILAKYRDTAIKTNDASIQLSFAKYLLEVGDPESTYEPVIDENNNNSDPAAALPPRPSSASGSSNSPPSSAPSSPATGPQDAKTGKKQLILEGVYWIDRLAKEGHPEAQFIRGTWYEEGMYLTKKNADKALRWYQSSSKGDYGPAHYKVAYFCEKKKDNNKAVMLYKKAAIHNDVPANHRLAMVYLYGDLGQSQNMKAGLQYLKRAASLATEAAPMSPYVLGLILSRDYSNQLKIPDDISFPDDGEALEWFRKSAQLGYGPANYKLGYCYEYGSLGCPIDPFLSVQHYERAVMSGDSNGEAEMALSGWYLSGADNCFAADDRLAFHYASKAAEKNLPKAQYAMGYYHEVGISVAIDLEKAMDFYKRAAENGNNDAKKRLKEQSAKFDPLGHKNSIKRMKNGRARGPKDGSCTIM
ncbi:hypothetical protein EC991_010049 [Linnemannia zychae]|nr:hypothetical protein EC991_010049 [Linnemannia zychae]